MQNRAAIHRTQAVLSSESQPHRAWPMEGGGDSNERRKSRIYKYGRAVAFWRRDLLLDRRETGARATNQTPAYLISPLKYSGKAGRVCGTRGVCGSESWAASSRGSSAKAGRVGNAESTKLCNWDPEKLRAALGELSEELLWSVSLFQIGASPRLG